MRDAALEQAVYGVQPGGGLGCLARSPGFLDEWLPEAERLLTDFGERPADVSCPGCVFAQPFGRRHVAVVQAADRGRDRSLVFRFIIIPTGLYRELGGDPFTISDQFSPPWGAEALAEGSQAVVEAAAVAGASARSGDASPSIVGAAGVVGVTTGPLDAAADGLPPLRWTAGPPPARTVEQLQKVLDVPHSATLLGGVQALLDGSRLVFERSEPAAGLVRALWALLPAHSRCEMWPASFAFAHPERFHVAVVPTAVRSDLTLVYYSHYLTEEQAGDYPEGRYELQLQTAVEHGDQKGLESLLARHSRRQMIQMAVVLLLVMVLTPPLLSMWFGGAPAAPPAVRAAAQPNLPAADACPALNDQERAQLAERLHQFAQTRGFEWPAGTSDAALADGVETIDRSLADGEADRDPGRLRDLGPVQRQLRALLWKHGVPDYDAPALTPVEMVNRLQDKTGAK